MPSELQNVWKVLHAQKHAKTPQETSPYAARSLSQTLRPQSLKPKGRSEMKRKASNRSQSHNHRPHFIGSRVERPGRVELLAQPEIRVVQDPVLGSGPVVPRVLAEVLELLQRATAQHLPQQQEQPVDLVLGRDHRSRRVLLPARLAPRQHRDRPLLRSPIVHRPLVLGDEGPDLQELLPQVVLDLEHPLAPPALHLSRDALYSVREEVAHAVHGGPPRRRPRERRGDTLPAVSAATR
ncbi:uncharacterized protein J3R85_002589 [Psidium guajava]|nr:uncharacterized protein J3R85_002589 [Psidium guajava]